jgi:hypothetical protein
MIRQKQTIEIHFNKELENMSEAAEAELVKKQLTKAELEAMREFHIDISWDGIKKAVKKAFYEAPFEAYQTGMLKLESVSRRMMTGKASLFGMPAGIVLRNSARSMYNSAADRYYYMPRVVGGLLTAGVIIGAAGLLVAPYLAVGIAAAAAVVGLPLVATGAAVTILGLPVIAAGAGLAAAGTATVGALATVGTYAAAIVATAILAPLAAYPIFTAATLGTSTLIGGIVAGVSTVFAAPLNFKAGYKRAQAAKKGIKLTDQEIEFLQNEFDKESPLVKRDQERFDQVRYNLSQMSDGKKEQIFLSLKAEFDAAAAQQAEAVAAPAAKKTPRSGISMGEM